MEEKNQQRNLAEISAIEIISQADILLMSAAAEKLGLSEANPKNVDLDEARKLISALAGLLNGSREFLGPHARPMLEGLTSLQKAFQEISTFPDEPGKGPGEKFAHK